MKWSIEIYLICSVLLLSCKEQPTHRQSIDYDQVKEDLMEMNKEKAESESVRLEEYIEESDWDAIKTGTGIYVYVYFQQDSSAVPAQFGQLAEISYEVRLLDGTLCYSTLASGPESFRVGMDNVESGLHEAIQYLAVGDKAKILLPSHRAYGFTGDQKKIPQDAAIIYDVELLSLN
jgi:FKBP-type peptidyl-prolyl cis-trans isomerase